MGGQESIGDRIRTLRKERRLSQVQLAHPELSDSYVSLIESGKRSPALAALRIIAEKLACSVTFLLSGVTEEDLSELRLAARYARLALDNGEVQEARTRFGELVGDERLRGSPDLAQDVEFGHALALEACGDLDEAAQRLAALLDRLTSGAYESTQQRRIEVALALSRCHRERGDLITSVRIGERVLEEESRTGWNDDLVELRSTILAAYFVRGDLIRAHQVATDLLKIADDLGTPRAHVAACWNAAWVAQARGEYDQAVTLTERALAFQAERAEPRNLGRLRLAYAIFLLQARPQEAARVREILQQVECELNESSASSADLAYCETELARTEIMLGRPDVAIRLAHEALDDTPSLARADVQLVLAQAYLLVDMVDEAAAVLSEAAESLAGMQANRQAAQVWFELAELLGQIGDEARQGEAYRRALACEGL